MEGLQCSFFVFAVPTAGKFICAAMRAPQLQ